MKPLSSPTLKSRRQVEFDLKELDHSRARKRVAKKLKAGERQHAKKQIEGELYEVDQIY